MRTAAQMGAKMLNGINVNVKQCNRKQQMSPLMPPLIELDKTMSGVILPNWPHLCVKMMSSTKFEVHNVLHMSYIFLAYTCTVYSQCSCTWSILCSTLG